MTEFSEQEFTIADSKKGSGTPATYKNLTTMKHKEALDKFEELENAKLTEDYWDTP